MKAYIDSNIIIDVLQNREPFFKESYQIIRLGLEGRIETLVSASDITNVYYIVRKFIHDPVITREKIHLLSNFVNICACTPEDVNKALVLFMPDFEDAVIAAAAKREKADYIITRNTDDFADSPVPAISPSQFLYQLNAF